MPELFGLIVMTLLLVRIHPLVESDSDESPGEEAQVEVKEEPTRRKTA